MYPLWQYYYFKAGNEGTSIIKMKANLFIRINAEAKSMFYIRPFHIYTITFMFFLFYPICFIIMQHTSTTGKSIINSSVCSYLSSNCNVWYILWWNADDVM